MFVQGNPLGKKPAPFSRLNCAMPIQEFVILFKRRLFLMLISIVLVTVMFYDYVIILVLNRALTLIIVKGVVNIKVINL